MEFRRAKGILQKTIGLILTKKENFNFALVFDNGRESEILSDIHTYFMRYPICILYLDKHKKIIRKIENALPNKFYKAECKARYIVELPVEDGRNYKIGYCLRKEAI